jgi:hypothetical protein
MNSVRKLRSFHSAKVRAETWQPLLVIAPSQTKVKNLNNLSFSVLPDKYFAV